MTSTLQALGKVLLTNYRTEDVLTMMTKVSHTGHYVMQCHAVSHLVMFCHVQVSQVVAMDYESNSSRQEFNNKKQIPFLYSTLIYKLFLKPK